MGWDGKIMTTPIGMGDISQAVSNSSLDLGYLIVNGYIHKWSKFKPFIHGSTSFTDDASRLDALRSANCGFTIPTTNSLADAMNKSASGNDWTYNRPAGGSSAWFRALDFKGYNNYQKPPFAWTITPNSGFYMLDGTPRVIMTRDDQPLRTDATYDYEDFPNTLGASGVKAWLLVRNFGATTTPAHYEITEGMYFPAGVVPKKECCVIMCKESDFTASSPKFYLLPDTYCTLEGINHVGISVNGGNNSASQLFQSRISIRPNIKGVGSERTLTGCKICFRANGNYTAVTSYPELYTSAELPNANEQFTNQSQGEFSIGTITCDTTTGYFAVPSGLQELDLRLPSDVNIRTDGRVFFSFTYNGTRYFIPISWREGANN